MNDSTPDVLGQVAPAPVFIPSNEPGWVMTERRLDLETPGEPSVYDVRPVVGWAVHTLSDEEGDYTVIRPVTFNLDTDMSEETPHVYFSRQLHRESQGGQLILTLAQIRKSVSE